MNKTNLKEDYRLSKYSGDYKTSLRLLIEINSVNEAVDYIKGGVGTNDPLEIIEIVEAEGLGNIGQWNENKIELKKETINLYSTFIKNKELDLKRAREVYGRKISQLEKSLEQN